MYKMKHIIILTILFAAAFSYSLKPINSDNAPIEPYIFEDLINSTIEGLRPDLPDPLTIDTYELSFPAEPDAVVVGNASISNFKLSGLQGFQLTALNFELIGLQLNLTLVLPEIDLYTDFDLDLSVMDTLGIYGDGNLTVDLGGLAIDVSAAVNLTGGIQVDNVRLAIQLESAYFELHGLFNDEELSKLISDILNDLAVSLIDENQELVTDLLSPIVQDLINAILGSLLQTTTAAPLDFITAGLK